MNFRKRVNAAAMVLAAGVMVTAAMVTGEFMHSRLAPPGGRGRGARAADRRFRRSRRRAFSRSSTARR